MSRVESSSEASMEEILASIRKIIADEPASAANPNAAPEPPPGPSGVPLPAAREPLVPETPAAPARNSAMPPFRSAASGSASGLSTQSSPLPLPTPPRSRAAIDDDLAGLIDVPAGEPPAPEAAPTVSPVEAAREKWANLLNPGGPSPVGATPLSPRTASAPAAAKMESPATPAAVSGLTPGAQSSTPGGSGLFAPRKGGFYPPQEPVRTDVPLPHAAGFVPPATAVEPSPAAAAKPAPTSDTPAMAMGVAPALVPAAKLADPLAPKAPSAVDVSAASARALDELAAGLNKSVTPASAPLPERPAREPAREPEGRAAPSSNAPFVSAPLSVPGTVTAPAAVAAFEQPAAEKASSETLNGRSRVASEASAPSPAAAVAGRSFEEVVAEMLRPMLEKWIDENMPRIVERALKLDASSGSKTDS